jgi:hypothetical protein
LLDYGLLEMQRMMLYFRIPDTDLISQGPGFINIENVVDFMAIKKDQMIVFIYDLVQFIQVIQGKRPCCRIKDTIPKRNEWLVKMKVVQNTGHDIRLLGDLAMDFF